MNKRQEIKNRIDTINKGEIPEGYKKIYGYICPNEWEIKPLNKLFDKIKLKNRNGQNLPVLTNSAIRGVVLQEEYFDREIVSEENTDNYYVVEDGCFMYNPRISSLAPAGPINKNDLGYTGIASPLYTVFKNKKDVIVDFYEKYFNSTFWFNYMKSISNQGARHDRLNVLDDDFFKMPIPCPSKEKQEKIAEILSCCDKVIELKEKLAEQYKQLKRSYLSEMFPKKNEKTPRLRFKRFTDAWEQRKLGDVVDIYDGAHQTPDYKDTGIMFLSVENISTLSSEKYISEEDFKRDYKIFPQKNDILMTRIGDIGTPNVVVDNTPKAFYVSLALLKYKNTNSHFLCNAIQSDFVKKGLWERSLITAIPMKINKDEIGKVNVMCPSFPEQEKIGAYFTALDRLITLHQRELEQYKQLKKSLSQLLLTGIVRVI